MRYSSRHTALSRLLAVTFKTLVAITFVWGIGTQAIAQNRPAEVSQDSVTSSQQQTSVSTASQTTTTDSAPGKGLVHIVPFGQIASSTKNAFAPGGAHLTYWGGPVISNIHVIAVFWGPNVNSAITGAPGIGQFFTDITTSRYFDLLTEYSTAGVQGSGVPATSSNQTIGRGVFDGKFTITPSVCPGPTICTVTDAQVASELASQINAGHLPQPVSDNQGNVNSFYMIYFPPGVIIRLDPSDSSCVQFCAYHSNTPSTLTPKFVPYGVEPDFAPPSACSTGCGGNPSLFDNVTEVTSHEMSEAITDALVGSATTTAPPLAWYDPNPVTSPLAEIGDICIAQGVSVPAGNTTYVVQTEFSNLQNDCVSAPPVLNLSAPPSGAGPALPFNLKLTIQSSVAPFTLTGYSGTVHFTSSDPQAVLPADYTFVPGDAGTHTFPVTLNTLGDQTITATDTHSSGFTGTITVNVNTTPDLTITKSHSGNFSVGQTGAAYTLAVSNSGHGPTSGTVTVTDTLPTGLTATAIAGTGWSCTLGPLTCTRADALAASLNYPTITLTVNVAANAPSLVTNTATVSGGGETNTANDSASDPTTILAPDMTVSKQHAGVINGSFFQGETGATYSIFVSNNGNLASFGTVTLVDTLPATGLTATDISGTGWSCTLATLTCTRTDALAPGSAYPVITVTVNVALDAPANVVNSATVSGGGEVNTGNDLSQDLTIVLPPLHPDLTPFMNHFNNFVQGQTGTYRIDVSNVGTAITSGAVTVSDTVPTGLTATDMSGIGWTCTVGATSSCTQSTPLQINDSSAPIFVTVNIAPNAPASVVNTVTVSGGGDTVSANNSFSDPTQIAVPLVDLTPNVSGTGFASQGQTNVPYTIFINNFGNIASSGTVTLTINLSTGLTATALSGTGWNCTLSSLTCSGSNPVAPNVGSVVNITMNVANNAPATGQVSATVSGGGDGNSANNTGSSGMTIQPMVSISPGQSVNTITAGQSAQFSMNVNPLPSSGGPAVMSCSGLPAASSCTFTPPSVPNNVGGQFVSLVISTTARSTALTVPPAPYKRMPIMPWAIVGLAALAAIGLNRSSRVMRRRLVLGFAGLLLLIGAVSGCGGGSNFQQVVTQQGTPAGTYTITVTATTPNETATTPLTLIVR